MPDAASLLRETLESYKAMRTYSANGSVTYHARESGDRVVTIRTAFSMQLAKPSRYKIWWFRELFSMNGRRTAHEGSGTVWNAGHGALLQTHYEASPEQFENDRQALAAATGISHGAAHHIPALFFGWNDHVLAQLRQFQYEGRTSLSRTPCILISGTARQSRYTLWVSIQEKLLMQIRQSFESQRTASEGKRLAKQTLAAILQREKQPISQEMKATLENLKARLKETVGPTRAGITKGEFIQIHRDIKTNRKIPDRDFMYSQGTQA